MFFVPYYFCSYQSNERLAARTIPVTNISTYIQAHGLTVHNNNIDHEELAPLMELCARCNMTLFLYSNTF
jgi:hypothetical protein